MADSMERIKLMVTIVDRDKTARAAEVYAAGGAKLHYAAPGLGTANSDLLDYLGLGETGKSFLFSLVPGGRSPACSAPPKRRCTSPVRGRAFSLPCPCPVWAGRWPRSFSSRQGHRSRNRRKACRKETDG